jgi:hypothetical protein
LGHGTGVFVEVRDHSQARAKRIKTDSIVWFKRRKELENLDPHRGLIQRSWNIQPVEQDYGCRLERFPATIDAIRNYTRRQSVLLRGGTRRIRNRKYRYCLCLAFVLKSKVVFRKAPDWALIIVDGYVNGNQPRSRPEERFLSGRKSGE